MKLIVKRVSLDLTNAYVKKFDYFSKNDVYFCLYDRKSRLLKSTVQKNAKGYLYSWEYKNGVSFMLDQKSSCRVVFFDKDLFFDDEITKVSLINGNYTLEYNDDGHKLLSYVDSNNATIEVEFIVQM